MLWGEFVREILARFESKTTLGLVGEFNKLKQWEDVESYRNKFEELKLLLLKDYPTYDEPYFITSYLSGLREDIRLNVLSNRPRTLKETYEASIYQEMLIEHKKKQNFQNQIQTSASSGFNAKDNNNLSTKPNPTGVIVKEENKCHTCGLSWFRGHRCKTRALNLVTGKEDLDVSEQRPAESETDEDEMKEQIELLLPQSVIEKEDDVRISLHAIGEYQNLDLIRIKGNANDVPVVALVDSGSTHSFVDPRIVKKAGYTYIQTRPVEITVANGEKMQCDKKCEGFTWSMQGEKFKFDLKVMEIGTHEMLLGGDWIKKVGPVVLDVNKLSLAMTKGGKIVVLKGVNEQHNDRVIKGELNAQHGELCMLMQASPMENKSEATHIPKELQVLPSTNPEVIKRIMKLGNLPKTFQPYCLTLVAVRKYLKLSSRYFEPFVVLGKIGAPANSFQLPPGSQIHPTFRVSQLEERFNKHVPAPNLLLVCTDGKIRAETTCVLDPKLVDRNGTLVARRMVRWLILLDQASTGVDYAFKKAISRIAMQQAPRGQGAPEKRGNVTHTIGEENYKTAVGLDVNNNGPKSIK